MGLQLVVTCVILHADHRQLVILTSYYSALGNNFLFFKTVELYRISVTLMSFVPLHFEFILHPRNCMFLHQVSLVSTESWLLLSTQKVALFSVCQI